MTQRILPPKSIINIIETNQRNSLKWKGISFKTWNKILVAILLFLIIGLAGFWRIGNLQVLAYGPKDGAKYNANENCLKTAYKSNYKTVQKDYENVVNCFQKIEAKYCNSGQLNYSEEYCKLAKRNITIVKASYVGNSNKGIVNTSSNNNDKNFNNAYFSKEFNVCMNKLPDQQKTITCLDSLSIKANQVGNTFYINQITNSRNTLQSKINNQPKNNFSYSYSISTNNSAGQQYSFTNSGYSNEQLSRLRYDIDATIERCRSINRYAYDNQEDARCAQNAYQQAKRINYTRGQSNALNLLAYIAGEEGDFNTAKNLYRRTCNEFNSTNGCAQANSIERRQSYYSDTDHYSNCSKYSSKRNSTGCDVAKIAAAVIVIAALVAALDS